MYLELKSVNNLSSPLYEFALTSDLVKIHNSIN